MALWLDIGPAAEVPSEGARKLMFAGRQIAIFRTAEGKFFALEDRCPHKQGPLSDGIVHGDCVTCPLHGWVINLASGTAQGADQGQVLSLPVVLEGDRLKLDIAALSAAAAE